MIRREQDNYLQGSLAQPETLWCVTSHVISLALHSEGRLAWSQMKKTPETFGPAVDTLTLVKAGTALVGQFSEI